MQTLEVDHMWMHIVKLLANVLGAGGMHVLKTDS